MIHFILIVDDDPADRELYSQWIRSQYADNCAIIAASGLAEAKEVLEQCVPNCIILDYRLLDGDGLDYLAYLKEYYGKVPDCVLFITGDQDEEIRKKALAGGATHFLHKSDLTTQSLIQQINKIILR